MLYIRTATVMVISFFTSRITLEVLGVNDYGLNNLISGVVSMFSFLNLSMGTAVQRFYTIAESKKKGIPLNDIFGCASVIHLIIAGITFLAAEIFALFFLYKLNIPTERFGIAQWVFQCSLFSLILDILLVPSAAYLRAKEEFSKLAIFEIFQSILRLVILYLICISTYDKLATLAFLGAIVTIIYFFAVRITAFTLFKDVTRPHFFFEKNLFIKMTSFSTLLLFSILSSIVYWQGLAMMLNVFFGLAINAAYGISQQLKTAVDNFLMSFKQSVVPQLMMAYATNERKRLHNIINFSTKLTYVLALLIVTPFIFETNLILKLWLKNPPPNTVTFVQLVFCLCILNSFSYFIIQSIQASGKVKGFSLVTSFTYLITLGIAYLLLKIGYNYYSVMYVSIFQAILVIYITLHYAKKTFEFNVRNFIVNVALRSTLYTIIVIFSSLTLDVFMRDGILRLCMNVLISLCLSIFSYYILFNRSERERLNFYLHKFKVCIEQKF